MYLRSAHVAFEKLADLVEGQLAPPEQSEVTNHVSLCTRCSADITWLRQTIGVMREDELEDAPTHVVARAARLLRQRQPDAASGPRRLLAVLQFDSAWLQPRLGVRAGQAVQRQLLFNVEGFDLDLRIMPSHGLWAMAGQVLGACEGGQIALQADTHGVTAELNTLCEFTLPPVPSGSYTLTLRLEDAEVEVTGLHLGA